MIRCISVLMIAVFLTSCGTEETVVNEKIHATVDESTLKGVVRTSYDSPELASARTDQEPLGSFMI